MFALATTRIALGPIEAPFALIESESVRKTKESRLSIMNEGWTVSEKNGAARCARCDIPAEKSKGFYSLLDRVARLKGKYFSSVVEEAIFFTKHSYQHGLATTLCITEDKSMTA
jgi:hypothetical protein